MSNHFYRSLREQWRKTLRRLQFWKKRGFKNDAPKLKKNYAKKFISRLWLFHDPKWSQAPKKSLFDSPGKPKLSAYANPIYWIVWAPKFVIAWLVSRPFLNLAPALPAIAATLVFCVLLFWDRYQGSAWRLTQYRRILQTAVTEKDYNEAIIACRTLINLTPYDDGLRFQQAVLELELGHDEMAKEMMVNLAATKRNGPASTWLLENSYDLSKLSEWTSQEHAGFRALVANAVEQKNRAAVDSAQLRLANYLTQMGSPRDAVKIVQELAARTPKLNLIGLGLALQSEDKELAVRFANNAVKYLEQFLSANPSAVQERLELAKTLVFLDREQDAANVLKDGLGLTQDESLKGGIAEVLVHYATRIAKEGDSRLVQRLQIIRNAMDYSPNNPSVIDAIIEIILDCKDKEGNQVELLRKSIVEGAAPEATHFIQGTLALLNGDHATALNHLKIAQSTGVNTPGLLNNLAMALQKTDDPERVAQALELSISANKLLADHPYLRDTRGQILLKLKRYDEAIPDLEFALRAPELATTVHASLATAYAALGQNDLADEHRKRSTEDASR
jgi:tetratricopeptide (TPR) repeat protein